MPTTITTTYAGEYAREYIAAALFSGVTLAGGHVTVKPNIKFKQVIKKLVASGLLGDSTCDFTDKGNVDISERYLEPKPLQINKQECKKTFEDDWEVIEMGFSAHQDMPRTFTDFVIEYYIALVAQAVEQSLWNGDAANDGEFSGFYTRGAADADTVKVAGAAGTETGLTAANVQEEMRKVTAAIPKAIRFDPNTKLFVASDVFEAYIQSLGGFGANGQGAAGVNTQGTMWYNNGNALSIDGIQVVLALGLNTAQMVAGQKENLWFGTGLISDQNEVRVIDMSEVDGSQNVRFIMRFTGDANYGISEEVVIYQPQPAAP